MANESYITVPPNVAGGNNIRQLQFTVAQPDGTNQIVLVEGVVLIDPNTGTAYSMRQDEAWKDEVVGLLRRVVRGLEILTGENIEDEEDDDNG